MANMSTFTQLYHSVIQWTAFLTIFLVQVLPNWWIIWNKYLFFHFLKQFKVSFFYNFWYSYKSFKFIILYQIVIEIQIKCLLNIVDYIIFLRHIVINIKIEYWIWLSEHFHHFICFNIIGLFHFDFYSI